MSENGPVFDKLVDVANSKGLVVKFKPLQYNDGRLRGNRIAIAERIRGTDFATFILAHEIAHAYLHYDKGDIINCELTAQYEEQADRAARMVLDVLR